MIEIFTIAYNEEDKIEFFIKWWRDRFPGCKITVYDNWSTDRTAEIANEHGCRVKLCGHPGIMDEQLLIEATIYQLGLNFEGIKKAVKMTAFCFYLPIRSLYFNRPSACRV